VGGGGFNNLFSVLPGKQQCLDGRDEDHCEQLFYSKCDNLANEFRCQNGLCIDSDFVLDGEIDCNDQAGNYLILALEIIPNRF
jgi:hypothetical protein